MNNLKPIKELPPFLKFCYTVGMLPTSYKISMTYEEQVLEAIRYIKEEIIPVITNHGLALTELQEKFIELVNYIDEYLENLDLQDEVNNKLDEMAESGELQEIITSYINLNSVITFSNVDEMKSSENLVAGSVAKTLGYYEEGDDGASEYLIVNDASLNTDDSFVIQLNNGLKAVLQYKEIVSILQLGGRRQKNNTKYDIHDYIEKYITKNENSKIPFTLFLPAGIYYTTPIEIVSTNYNIQGQCERTGVLNGVSAKATILSAYTNQEYIIKCGNATTGSGYGTIENIIFSTCVFDDDFARLSYNEVSNACLIFSWVYFMRSRFLSFEYIKGTAFKITTSWELMFDFIDFYHIDAHENGIFVFDEVITSVENGNISDSNFQYLRFEQIIGNCIKFKNNNKTGNVHFGVINVEPSAVTDMGYEWHEFEDVTFDVVNCVLALEGGAVFQIDDIELNGFYHRYHVINNMNYMFGDVIHLEAPNLGYRIILNTIYLANSNKPSCLIKTMENASDLWLSKIIINNLINYSQHNMLLDVKKLARLQLNSPIGTLQISDNRIIQNEGNRIPCYKNASLHYTSVNGLIEYSEEAVNPEHLVIKNNGLLTGVGKRLFGFIYNSTTLKVRAKIENGESVIFRCYVYNPATNTFLGLSNNITLTGTGEFEEYTLELNDNSKLYGAMAYFQIVNNNVTTDIELDTFAN